MSSSEIESQMEESSSDEEQENEYDRMNQLMGNLAPYDHLMIVVFLAFGQRE